MAPSIRFRAGDMLPLAAYFSAEKVAWLDAIAQFGLRFDTPICLVGGAVRDLLLQQEVREFDLMIEGDLTCFLPSLCSEWACVFGTESQPTKVVQFARYRTAKLIFARPMLGFSELDFSSARREEYSAPGAVPTVWPGTIDDDLARRDFGCNAIALRLRGDSSGVLLDPHSGGEDLRLRQLRVLHAASFRDDPMRILRAARFITRLSFSLEPKTAELLRTAVREGWVAAVSPGRIGSELWKLLREVEAIGALRVLIEWGVLEQILPSAGVHLRTLTERPPTTEPSALFAALFGHQKPSAMEAARTFNYSRDVLQAIEKNCS